LDDGCEETKEVDAENSCSICLEPLLQDVSMLSCSHALHNACLAGLHEHGVSLACPLCRAPILGGDVLAEALEIAAYECHLEIVQFLLGCLSQNPSGHEDAILRSVVAACGESVLFVRTSTPFERRLSVVKCLVESELYAPRVFGQSALMRASWKGDHDAVELLAADPGASVNAKDTRGRTALMISSERGHLNVVRLLVGGDHCGADMDAEDKCGNTALSLASARAKRCFHAMRVEAFLREKYDELWGPDCPDYDDPHADEAEDTYNRYDRFCW